MITKDQFNKAIENISNGLTINKACNEAGFTSRTFYYQVERDFGKYEQYKKAEIKYNYNKRNTPVDITDSWININKVNND